MKRTKIPYGTAIPVTLTIRQRDLIRDHTFYNPDFANLALANDTGIKIDLTLDDIEEIQGYVAAEANHCDDPALQKELDTLFEVFESYLNAYNDQGE